jgi:hypothetical protein
MTRWRELEAVVVEQFKGPSDLQSRAVAMIGWLREHSLDNPARIEAAARMACARETRQAAE